MTKPHITVKRVNWLVVLVFVVLGLLISSLRASAQAGVLYNGGVNSSDGWYIPGSAGAFTGALGHLAAGSLYLDGGGHVQNTHALSLSQSNAPWVISAFVYAPTIPAALALYSCSVVPVTGIGDCDWNESFVDIPSANQWYILSAEIYTTGTRYVSMWHNANEGYNPIYVDDISVSIPNYATATPVNTPTATPASVSGSSAASAISAGAATPYFRSTNVSGVIPYMQEGSGTMADMAKISVDQREMSFCLPDQVSDFISDITLCFSIPAFELVEWNLLGVDILPYAAIVGVGLFIVFIIRQLQER